MFKEFRAIETAGMRVGKRTRQFNRQHETRRRRYYEFVEGRKGTVRQ